MSPTQFPITLTGLSRSEDWSSTQDQARLTRMVADHFDFIWRLLRRNGVPEGDADDLTQRVFLTAARRLHDIRPAAERAFLFSVAVGEAGHLRRTYRRRGEVSVEALAEATTTGSQRPDELAGKREALAFVDTIIQEMPDDLRIAFVLFEIEELSGQQVAALLEIPIGTAKSRLRRAREDFSLRVSSLRSPLSSKP